MDICGYVLVRSPRGISISLDLALKRVRSLALARRLLCLVTVASNRSVKGKMIFKLFYRCSDNTKV